MRVVEPQHQVRECWRVYLVHTTQGGVLRSGAYVMYWGSLIYVASTLFESVCIVQQYTLNAHWFLY